MRDATGRHQCALIIGGTSEIGRAIAERLLDAGTDTLVLAGRDPDALSLTAAQLDSRGTVVVAPYDGRDNPVLVRLTLDDIAARVGDLDVICICVGSLVDQRLLDTDTECSADVLRDTMLAPSIAAHAAVNLMARQGHGTVVVLSSAAAVRPRSSILTYGVAKAGLDAFVIGLGERFRGMGVRVLVVRPGYVRTRMTAGIPAPPLAIDADDVGRAVLNGLRTDARVIYVPAAMRAVMLALQVTPKPLFRRLPI